MQLFNSLNARKIGLRDFNIFDNFFNNFWYFFILIIEFAATYFMTLLGGKIFRLVPIDWQTLVTGIGFGLGCLGVSAGLKAIPEQHVNKVPDLINENAVEGQDMLSKFSQQMQGKGPQRSETQKLLDSN